MANTDHRDESHDIGALLLSGLKGTLIGVASVVVLALILTAAALAFPDPDSVVGAFAYAALGIGALACGIAAVRADAARSIVGAVIGGVGYVLILWLVSLFMRDGAETMPPALTAVAYAVCVIASMLGGLIARGRRIRIGEGKNSPTALMRKQLGARR